MGNKWRERVRRWTAQSGQSVAEYAWILVLIVIVSIVLLRTIRVSVNNMLADTNANMPR
jgi:Flp pilus assembly pilin Flp